MLHIHSRATPNKIKNPDEILNSFRANHYTVANYLENIVKKTLRQTLGHIRITYRRMMSIQIQKYTCAWQTLDYEISSQVV